MQSQSYPHRIKLGYDSSTPDKNFVYGRPTSPPFSIVGFFFSLSKIGAHNFIFIIFWRVAMGAAYHAAPIGIIPKQIIWGWCPQNFYPSTPIRVWWLANVGPACILYMDITHIYKSLTKSNINSFVFFFFVLITCSSL